MRPPHVYAACPTHVLTCGCAHEYEPSHLQLLLELCDKTVKDEVKARKGGQPTRQEVARMLRAVVSALAFMHDKNMAHCDIDPRNVLLRPDGSYCLGV